MNLNKILFAGVLLAFVVVLVGCTQNPEGDALKVSGVLEENTDQPFEGCSASTANGCSCSASGSGSSCLKFAGAGKVQCSDSSGTTSCNDGDGGSCVCTDISAN